MRSDSALAFVVGVMTGVAASALLYLIDVRNVRLGVEELRREADRLGGSPERPPADRISGPEPQRVHATVPAGQPAEGAAAAVANDPYQAQIARREVGRQRPEERGDFEMVD